MNAGTLLGNRLGLPQHLARDGCGVPFAECKEAQEIRDRVAFGPAEVGVRLLAGSLSDSRSTAAIAFGTAGLLVDST